MVHLCMRYQLSAWHPLRLAVLASVPFWVGNVGILCGKRAGPAAWGASATPDWLHWEEMATFHICGLLGNECLFRSYRWLAMEEAAASAGQGGRCAPAGWLVETLTSAAQDGKQKAL